MYYTVIKHSGHLRTPEKCRKNSPAARVVYISLVFSNARRVLSQCNTRLRLLYLLNIYNVKVSYSCSCLPNMGSIINNHNKKILIYNNNTTLLNGCNRREKDRCPLDNNYVITSVIYKANVTTDKDNTGKNYIGLTEGTLKQRYTQHKLSFRNRNMLTAPN